MLLEDVIEPYLEDKPTQEELLSSLQYELEMLQNPYGTWYEDLDNKNRLKLVRELKSYIKSNR